MGFADYLSRQPNSPPTGENIDKNHVINTIMTVHYTLHKTHRKQTNQKARNLNTNYDVNFHSKRIGTKQSAFCRLPIAKQLH